MRRELFTLHDVTDYPLVRFVAETAVAGYGARWNEEMDRLVAGSRPFVLVYPPAAHAEAHEDRVIRGSWLKRNKGALASKCLALVVVEPDAARRAELEAMVPNLVKAFGTPRAVRASMAESEALARQLLEDGDLTTSGAGTDRP